MAKLGFITQFLSKHGSSFLLGGALGSVAVTAMIAVSSAAAWQADLIDHGMTPDEAETAYAAAQRAVFIATAHPYVEPSYLDIASLVPGWGAIFTAGFTHAMLVLGVVVVVTTAVAFIGLRDRRAPA